MRVCGLFPTPPAPRAKSVLGLEHFRATADGGVLALSFVTALLARPWKVGVPCQDHLRECSRRAVYRGGARVVPGRASRSGSGPQRHQLPVNGLGREVGSATESEMHTVQASGS